MRLDPRHLEILAAIVEHGGLTEGATSLGKSQPSVSRSIAMLESRLGIQLFEPHRRPLQPTEFCLALAQEGRKILEAGKAASALVAQRKMGVSGAIRLGGTPIFMDGVIAPVLASFQAQFPDVRIDQSYGYAGEILERLQNGTLDVGIVPIRVKEVPPDIDARQLLPGRNVIACRAGHPLARKDSVQISEVAKNTWIAPPPESPLYQDLRSVLDGIGITDIKVSFSGGSLSSVINVLSQSDSLTVLPYSVVYNLRRQKSVVPLPIRIGDPDRHLHVLARPAGAGGAAQTRLVKFIENEMSPGAA